MSSPPDSLIDLGLHAERTALAWRRTGLGVGVGGVVAFKVAGPALGPVVAVVAVVGGVLAVVAFWTAGHRYRVVQRSLRDRGDLAAWGHPAGPLLAVSVATTLIGAIALAYVLTS
jgi:uncharacterized membrane protein YidH (DUF202 family)